MIRASTPTAVRFHISDEDEFPRDNMIKAVNQGELELKPLHSFSALPGASPASFTGENSESTANAQSASTRLDSSSAPVAALSQHEMKSQEMAITYQMASQTISIRLSDAELKKNMRTLDETEMSELVSGNHGLEKEMNHIRPIEELKTELKSKYPTGARRAGNVLSPPKSQHWFFRLAELCLGGFNWLLIIIALLDVLSWRPLGENPGPPQPINWYTGVTLYICIFINTVFTAYQLRKSSNILKGFRNLIPTQATVWDDSISEWKVIPAEQLQRGDIVQLRSGSKVPADVRLLTCNGLKVDNSMLTGESEPVSCSTRCTSANYLETRNMAFFGSMAVEGEASGLVVDIGDSTVMGRITQLTGSTKKKKTSLEIEIDRFVRIIVTLIILTLIPSLLTWRFWLYDAYPSYLTVPAMVANVGAFVVGYTPEGLSVALTMTLTIVAARMAKQNVLVKDLAIIEAFNTISLIASDKTGTLTQNCMSVRRVKWGLTSQAEMEVDSLKKNGTDTDSTQGNPLDSKILRDLARCAILCNSASRIAPAPSVIDVKDNSTLEPVEQTALDQCFSTLKQWGRSLAGHMDLPSQKADEFDGNASDRALFQWMEPYLDVNEYRKRNPAIATQPFNSRNKYMISIHRLEQPNAGMLLFLKGAPEVVLGRCSRVLDADGVTIRKMTDSERAEWSAYQEAKGAQGERVLGFAGTFLDLATYPLNYRFNVDEGGDKPNYPTTELIFFGMASLIDPPRPEVPAALARCRSAHIRVAMVTGDHPSTATAIAEQIGLLSYKERDTFTVTTDAANRVLFVANSNGVAVGTHNVVSKIGVDGPLFTSVSDNVGVTDPSFTVADHQSRLQRGITVTGTQLSLMDEPLWNWVLRHDEIVFARVTPEQKLKIVTEAQARDEMVAVTGDGVNDAPALRQANLGIAMFNGSEVAREAGHIILVDNNFNSIVNGIELGRTVYDNMKKCIAYLLPAGTWSEMLTILCNVFLGIQPMLSAFLMIIICLCTDVFVSIALVNETAESQVMTRHPRKKDERLVNAKLILTMYMTTGWMMFFASTINYFWYSSDQGMNFNCTFWAFNWGDGWCDKSADELFEIVSTGQCIFFVTLVIMQWGNAFAVRTRRVSIFQHNPFWGPHKNLYLPVGIFFAFLMLLFITLTPFFQIYFGTRQVPIKYALVACCWAVLLVVWDEIRKLIIRKFPNSIVAKVAW